MVFPLPSSDLTLRVVAGAHNLKAGDGNEQTFSVSQIVIHPSWNGEAARG